MKEKRNAVFMILALFSALLIALMGGCDGSAYDYSNDPAEGQVTLSVKDAPSDDIDVFEADIVQIELIKAGGAVVTTLPSAQRINFADLTEMSEILSRATIPCGLYIGAVITIDFSDALVLLEGSDTPADLYDDEGNPINGIINVPLQFKGSNRPYIVETKATLLNFDLDLNSSCDVDTSGNSVTFTPVISCKADPSDPVVTGGKIMSVNTENKKIEVGIWNRFAGIFLGRYTIKTDNDTIFHIHGQAYRGDTGLQALSLLPFGAPIRAHGVFNGNENLLKADFIVGGLGVPAGDEDCVHGFIIGRDTGAGTDALLTVKGRCFDRNLNRWVFNRVWTVQISYADTKVVRWKSESSLDTDHLNVGQRIRAFGTLNGTELDASQAGSGLVRTLYTDVFGYANGPVSGDTLEVDLVRIGHRRIEIFDFSVDGAPVADPLMFLVDANGMDPTGLDTGYAVRVRGFVAPLTAGSEDPDFSAQTIVNRKELGSLLTAIYLPAEPDVLVQVSETGIVMDVASALIAGVDNGFEGFSPLSVDPQPSIVPHGPLGIYHIIENGTVAGFITFDKFTDEIAKRLSKGSLVRRVSAIGIYDDSQQKIEAAIVTVILE